uniref:Uncharacterized protein n=1 Tax=Arundo donax TaxID=35708 RepID=A0A0A9BWU4_ARUDO
MEDQCENECRRDTSLRGSRR